MTIMSGVNSATGEQVNAQQHKLLHGTEAFHYVNAIMR